MSTNFNNIIFCIFLVYLNYCKYLSIKYDSKPTTEMTCYLISKASKSLLKSLGRQLFSILSFANRPPEKILSDKHFNKHLFQNYFQGPEECLAQLLPVLAPPLTTVQPWQWKTELGYFVLISLGFPPMACVPESKPVCCTALNIANYIHVCAISVYSGCGRMNHCKYDPRRKEGCFFLIIWYIITHQKCGGSIPSPQIHQMPVYAAVISVPCCDCV